MFFYGNGFYGRNAHPFICFCLLYSKRSCTCTYCLELSVLKLQDVVIPRNDFYWKFVVVYCINICFRDNIIYQIFGSKVVGDGVGVVFCDVKRKSTFTIEYLIVLWLCQF